MLRVMRSAALGLLLVSVSFAQETTEDNNWHRIKLDERFRSEGVAAADFNNDGRLDVVAGDVWYQAPQLTDEGYLSGKGWKIKEVRQPGEFVAGKGYSQSFVNVAHDVDQDGWIDVIIVGFPGSTSKTNIGFRWYKNPGADDDSHWVSHEIWPSVCNESPEFEDLTGDGKPEIIFGSEAESKMGYVTLPAKSSAAKQWEFVAVSEAGDPKKNGTFKYYHGLGVGDVNNDGRQDLMIPHGWWESPKAPTKEAWKWHDAPLTVGGEKVPAKGANMHTIDLDLDGDSDILMSSAHAFGIWWFENTGGNETPAFTSHLIDESYSQTHALEFIDMNGDGEKDLVTGKRFFAHNGRDPGGNDKVVMYWYEIKREKGMAPKFLGHEIVAGRGTGIGTQFQIADMNGDKQPDIVLSNKKGVNVLVQKSK